MVSEANSPAIPAYGICCVQANWEASHVRAGTGKAPGMKQRNLDMMCSYLDACFGSGPPPSPVKIVCFPEFGIGGNYSFDASTQEVKQNFCISMPGPETDRLAEKAQRYGAYIAAHSMENDPRLPDNFFNTAFIINPEGKIILKYRKMNTAFGCCPHDIMDEYVNPVTGTRDFFPVVDTRIGRLACFVCGDLGIPEIPRMLALKGAEVLLHLSSGYSWEVAICQLRARAADNTVYIAHENWAGQSVGPVRFGEYETSGYIDTRGGGGSMIVDYNGNVIARDDGATPQLVMGMVNVMALRKDRELWKQPAPFGVKGNFLANTRTELYAPFYNKTIFPPNTVLREGPMAYAHDASVGRRRKQAIENLKSFHEYYSEKDVR